MRRYRLFGHTVASELTLELPGDAGHGIVSLEIRVVQGDGPDAELETVAPTYTSARLDQAGRSVLLAYRRDSGDVLSFPGRAVFRVTSTRIDLYPLRASRHELEVLLLGTVLAYWLGTQGIVTLHGAAVALAGAAIAILGANGAGKTSLALSLARLGHPLITDDLLALRCHLGGFLAVPSYPALRLWPEQARRLGIDAEGFPRAHPAVDKRRLPTDNLAGISVAPTALSLAAIFLLQRKPVATSQPVLTLVGVPPARSVANIVRHSFAPELFEAMGLREAGFSAVATLAARVPVCRLEVADDMGRLAEAAEALGIVVSQGIGRRALG